MTIILKNADEIDQFANALHRDMIEGVASKFPSLPKKDEASELLHDLNELFYAQEGVDGYCMIKADDPLLRKLAHFVSKVQP